MTDDEALRRECEALDIAEHRWHGPDSTKSCQANTGPDSSCNCNYKKKIDRLMAFATAQRKAVLKITKEEEFGVGYIAFKDIGDGESVQSVEVEGMDLVLDFNKNGELLGVEFLNLNRMPPHLRAQAAKEPTR